MEWNVCNGRSAVRYLMELNRMTLEELKCYLFEAVYLALKYNLKISNESIIAYFYLKNTHDILVITEESIFVRRIVSDTYTIFVKNENNEPKIFNLTQVCDFMKQFVYENDIRFHNIKEETNSYSTKSMVHPTTETSVNMNRIVEGDIVVHFKGKMYRVISVDVEHTETGDRYVCYQAMYGECKTYVRPYDTFMSKVDREKYPDIPIKYRMTVYSLEDSPVNVKEESEDVF